MKKNYIEPRVKVVAARTANMICTSTTSINRGVKVNVTKTKETYEGYDEDEIGVAW